MHKQSFSFRKRIKSFGFALKGLKFFLFHEHNAWIHLVATCFAIVLGFALRLNAGEWTFILLVTALVWITEIINTAIEQLCNTVSTEENPGIGLVKDLAAGAVLVAAFLAVITAFIIFLPKILNLCSQV